MEPSELSFNHRLQAWVALTRLNKPIGIYLVLWPTLWALWISVEGLPSLKVLVIFTLGVVLMRSAGCAINDYADRHVDGKVNRTKARPLASGMVPPSEAIKIFLVLSGISFLLVLFTNTFTVYLSFGAVALAAIYPFMKRYTYLPQVVLGAAFAWSIPMAYAAQEIPLDASTWLLYIATVLWTVAYDTFYAMVDREDDLKIGVKSTAILFGDADKIIIGLLQGLTLLALLFVGLQKHLGLFFYLSLAVASGLFIWQQWITKNKNPEDCFRAFLHNNWVGVVVFVGVFLDYLFKTAY